MTRQLMRLGGQGLSVEGQVEAGQGLTARRLAGHGHEVAGADSVAGSGQKGQQGRSGWGCI